MSIRCSRENAMPCCICASAYRPFTTSSRVAEDRTHAKQMGTKRAEVRGDRHAGRGGLQCCGDEPVELAGAGGLWRTDDHLLASAGSAGLEPDSVRRMAWAAGSSPTLASADEGAMGAHDPGGTRAVPPRSTRPLWQIWGADDRTEGRPE